MVFRTWALAYAAANRYLVRLPRSLVDVETARRGTMCLGELADSVAGGTRYEPQEGAAVPTRHDATTWSRHDRRYAS